MARRRWSRFKKWWKKLIGRDRSAKIGKAFTDQAGADDMTRSVQLTIGTGTAPVPSTWETNGIPTQQGDLLVGAATSSFLPVGINSVASIETTEALIGEPLSMHRMYYIYSPGNGRHWDQAAGDAAATHVGGRIPWQSFKLQTYSWASVAAGADDAWLTQLAASLGALNGPVWVTIHHEPDNDGNGTPADFIAMQRHVSPIFRAYPNIAFAVVVAGYWMWHSGSYTWDSYYPGDAYTDIYAWDPYNFYKSNNDPNGAWTEATVSISSSIYSFWDWRQAGGHTCKWGLSELGYNAAAAATPANYYDPNLGKTVATAGPGNEWIQRACNDISSRDGGITVAYWDNMVSGGNDYRITGDDMKADLGAAARASAFYSEFADPDVPVDGPDYQSTLVLNENWDTLDTDLWYPENSTYGDDGNRIQRYRTENVTTSAATSGGTGNSLKLTVKREFYIDRDFTAGMLGTRDVGVYYPRYGRYEMKARIPHGHGIWPAFWLRHRNGSSICEPDVMEYFIGQVPGKLSNQVHYTNNSGSFIFNGLNPAPWGGRTTVYEAPVEEGQQRWVTTSLDILPWTASTFEAGTYGDPDAASDNVLWQFSQDGVVHLQYVLTSQTNWTNRYDDNAFDICLQGSQVGGDWIGHPDDPVGYSRWKSGGSCIIGGTAPNSCTITADGYTNRAPDFPNTFEVDHVRVWKYTGAPA